MYAAKTNDHTIALYTPDMDRGRVERLALLADLRLALDHHPEQLLLHYQPKVDIHDGQVLSVEALIRWNHPVLGVLSPDRFLPLAESTSLIEPLTQCVLDRALRDCHDWTSRGHNITVAVNLSARNINDPTLPTRVAQALRRANLARRPAHPRNHRKQHHGRGPTRPSRSCTNSPTSASPFPSTTSAPATPACPTCNDCPSTKSRSTGLSSPGSPTATPPTAEPSSAASPV